MLSVDFLVSHIAALTNDGLQRDGTDGSISGPPGIQGAADKGTVKRWMKRTTLIAGVRMHFGAFARILFLRHARVKMGVEDRVCTE